MNKLLLISFQYRSCFFILIFLFSNFGNSFSQTLDSIGSTPTTSMVKKAMGDSMKHKTRLYPSLIVPAILIGYGLTTFKGHGLYSSYAMQRDVQNHLIGLQSEVDDYLVFLPFAEFIGLRLLKVKSKNDLINTGLLFAKSQLLMLSMVYTLKYTTKVLRPDGSNEQSFPSGHTAQVFLAATIVHKEFRHRSPWYGIGAYTAAATVGAFRIINNRHWQSDVLVGAGLGILSGHLVYATHRHRWGRKEVSFIPLPGVNFNGFAFVCGF